MEENAEEGVEVEVADMAEIDNSECLDLIEKAPPAVSQSLTPRYHHLIP